MRVILAPSNLGLRPLEEGQIFERAPFDAGLVRLIHRGTVGRQVGRFIPRANPVPERRTSPNGRCSLHYFGQQLGRRPVNEKSRSLAVE